MDISELENWLWDAAMVRGSQHPFRESEPYIEVSPKRILIKRMRIEIVER